MGVNFYYEALLKMFSVLVFSACVHQTRDDRFGMMLIPVIYSLIKFTNSNK